MGKYKIINLIFLFVSLAVFVIGTAIGFYLLNFYECGASIFCYDLTTKAYALFYGMGALSIVFLTLLALPNTFNSWKKFAVWFVPIISIIFITYDDKGRGFMEISPSSEHIFLGLSILYILASLAIIGYSHYKSKARK